MGDGRATMRRHTLKQTKRVLVTGGCGQLGAVVVSQLIEAGYDPVVIDKGLSHPDIERMVQEETVTFYPCDLLREDEVRHLGPHLSQIPYAMHLASVVEGSADILESAVGSIELNIMATINLLSILPNLQHLVYASSMMVYGDPQSVPISERHVTEPINVYGATKLAAEKFLQVYSLQQNVKTAILRLSSLYGPGEYSEGNRNRVIPLFVRKIRDNETLMIYPGDDEEIRDYLHLHDAARAFVLAIQKGEGGVFNIGSRKGISIRELMETMVRLSRKEVKCEVSDRRPSRPANYTLDITKAKSVLGFEPRISIQDGLREEMQALA